MPILDNTHSDSDSYIFPIIAVVGLCGTGKSEVCNYLVEKNYTVIYFGGTVIHEVKKRGLAVNPDNERFVREDLRKQYGMAAMAHINLPIIYQLLAEGKSVAIDGLYSTAELEILRANLGNQLQLLAIHSPKQLRYERLGKRLIRPMTVQQINDRDQLELLHLDKAIPIVLADAHIVNDRDKAYLYAQLNQTFQYVCNWHIPYTV